MSIRDARPADITSASPFTRAGRDRAHDFHERIGHRQKATSCPIGRDLT